MCNGGEQIPTVDIGLLRKIADSLRFDSAEERLEAEKNFNIIFQSAPVIFYSEGSQLHARYERTRNYKWPAR